MPIARRVGNLRGGIHRERPATRRADAELVSVLNAGRDAAAERQSDPACSDGAGESIDPRAAGGRRASDEGEDPIEIRDIVFRVRIDSDEGPGLLAGAGSNVEVIAFEARSDHGDGQRSYVRKDANMAILDVATDPHGSVAL